MIQTIIPYVSAVFSALVAVFSCVTVFQTRKIQNENLYQANKDNYEKSLPFFKVSLVAQNNLRDKKLQREQPLVNGEHDFTDAEYRFSYLLGPLFSIQNVSDKPALLIQVICGEKKQKGYKLSKDNSFIFTKNRLQAFNTKDNADKLLFGFNEHIIRDNGTFDKETNLHNVRVGVYFLNENGQRIKITYELSFIKSNDGRDGTNRSVDGFKFVGSKFINTSWPEPEFSDREDKESYNYSDFLKKNISIEEQAERERYVKANYHFEDLEMNEPYKYSEQ